MSHHLVLCGDCLITPERLPLLQESKPAASAEQTPLHNADKRTSDLDIEERGKQGLYQEEESLVNTVECRICQEEDSPKNLEIPCACSGSMKFAHRKCVQYWCNEKGDTVCEICHQPYQPGYTASLPPPQTDDTVIDVSEGLAFGGTPLDLHDARLMAVAAAEHQILEAQYDEHADRSATGAAFCRSAALILIALLLMRHVLSLNDGDEEDDASTFFSLFLLRAVGFLLPCYIMVWGVSMLQRRRQRQEDAEALAAAEVAFMLHAGQNRGLPEAEAPGSLSTPHQDSPY